MTRQMADDEVLRVLDRCVRCAAVGANPHYAGWHDDMTRSHAYVAALQAERDADKAALEALHGQVAGLVEKLRAPGGGLDEYYADGLNAAADLIEAELPAIKERMG